MTDLDALTEHMSLFRFTRIEAQIYVELLQHAALNGSQLAKIVDLPRSTVYNALANLEKRGAAILVPGATSVYRAEEPEALFGRIKAELQNSAAQLSEGLSQLSVKKAPTGFANIEGYENALAKTREFLRSAQQEVYLHTNLKLSLFAAELQELRDRDVRVIVFSFSKINDTTVPVEFFYSDKFAAEQAPYSKILLVIDRNNALVIRGYAKDDFRGMYSDDAILIDLLSEHFHHDIYLHRLEQKYGVRNIVDDQIMLGSIQESSSKLLSKT